MNQEIFIGIMIPFVGTLLGAAMVYLLRDNISGRVQKVLLGFAAGVMTAASVWSLLIPAMDMSADMGKLAFIPASIGLLIGFAFLLILDSVIPHQHINSDEVEGIQPHNRKIKKSTMLSFAVTLHNVPEGMAVGVTFAGMISGNNDISMASAYVLALGIAIQNFPEGAIISMPLRSAGMSKNRAFVQGMLSGIVEPIAAFITILLASILTPILPYFLAFAAGAMLYVVVEELIPEANEGAHSNWGTVGYAIGFCIMMILDIALG